MRETMYAIIVSVLVSVVCADLNSTDDEVLSGSRMSWMKGLMDHHDWLEVLDANLTLPPKCASDLREYVVALNKGQLWASKRNPLWIPPANGSGEWQGVA
ncbi:unnamed protein product, partial [Iphiclides podalirius]